MLEYYFLNSILYLPQVFGHLDSLPHLFLNLNVQFYMLLCLKVAGRGANIASGSTLFDQSCLSEYLR